MMKTKVTIILLMFSTAYSFALPVEEFLKSLNIENNDSKFSIFSSLSPSDDSLDKSINADDLLTRSVITDHSTGFEVLKNRMTDVGEEVKITNDRSSDILRESNETSESRNSQMMLNNSEFDETISLQSKDKKGNSKSNKRHNFDEFQKLSAIPLESFKSKIDSSMELLDINIKCALTNRTSRSFQILRFENEVNLGQGVVEILRILNAKSKKNKLGETIDIDKTLSDSINIYRGDSEEYEVYILLKSKTANARKVDDKVTKKTQFHQDLGTRSKLMNTKGKSDKEINKLSSTSDISKDTSFHREYFRDDETLVELQNTKTSLDNLENFRNVNNKLNNETRLNLSNNAKEIALNDTLYIKNENVEEKEKNLFLISDQNSNLNKKFQILHVNDLPPPEILKTNYKESSEKNKTIEFSDEFKRNDTTQRNTENLKQTALSQHNNSFFNHAAFKNIEKTQVENLKESEVSEFSKTSVESSEEEYFRKKVQQMHVSKLTNATRMNHFSESKHTAEKASQNSESIISQTSSRVKNNGINNYQKDYENQSRISSLHSKGLITKSSDNLEDVNVNKKEISNFPQQRNNIATDSATFRNDESLDSSDSEEETSKILHRIKAETVNIPVEFNKNINNKQTMISKSTDNLKSQRIFSSEEAKSVDQKTISKFLIDGQIQFAGDTSKGNARNHMIGTSVLNLELNDKTIATEPTSENDDIKLMPDFRAVPTIRDSKIDNQWHVDNSNIQGSMEIPTITNKLKIQSFNENPVINIELPRLHSTRNQLNTEDQSSNYQSSSIQSEKLIYREGQIMLKNKSSSSVTSESEHETFDNLSDSQREQSMVQADESSFISPEEKLLIPINIPNINVHNMRSEISTFRSPEIQSIASSKLSGAQSVDVKNTMQDRTSISNHEILSHGNKMAIQSQIMNLQTHGKKHIHPIRFTSGSESQMVLKNANMKHTGKDHVNFDSSNSFFNPILFAELSSAQSHNKNGAEHDQSAIIESKEKFPVIQRSRAFTLKSEGRAIQIPSLKLGGLILQKPHKKQVFSSPFQKFENRNILG